MAKGSKRNDLKNASKGLGALLGYNSTEEEVEEVIEEKIIGSNIATISIKKIAVNPKQPRRHFDEEPLKQLAASIETHGLIQPITVRQMPNGSFQLISGERRFRASKLAGKEEITAYIRDTGDEEMHVLALIENIQREDLNPLEVAISLKLLQEEKGYSTDEELAGEVGKSRTQVTNFKRLLKLPPDIMDAIREKKISFGHAKALAGLKDITVQLVAFNEIIEKDLNVRKTEELVKAYQPKKKSKQKADPIKTDHYRALAKQFSEYFSLKADIKSIDNKHGNVILKFSDDDIDRIMDLLEE